MFVFADGPFWNHLWELERIDRAIWYSYAIVPALVLVVLWFERRLSATTFLFGTIETSAYKFGVTFLIAHAAWAFAEPAPPRPRAVFGIAAAPRRPAPSPSPIDPSETGEIRGVTSPGALVYVESGLEHLIFAPSDAPVRLAHDGRGFDPPLSAAQAGQPIEVISLDGRMHTLRAIDRRHIIRRNVAVPPSARAPVLPFERAYGRLELDCTAHRKAERPAELVVLSHPFFARAGADGRFRISGVPQGRLVVTALDSGRTSSRSIGLVGGAVVELALPVTGGGRSVPVE